MNDLRDIIHDGVDANRALDKLRIVHSTHGGRTTWHKRKVISVAAPLQGGAMRALSDSTKYFTPIALHFGIAACIRI